METQKDRAKEYYFSNPDCTLAGVATELDIPYETVRDWSKTENWSTQRQIEIIRRGYPDDIVEQAELIRTVLFSRIIEPGVEDSDLKHLVSAWQSLLNIRSQDDTLVDRDSLFLDDEDYT